MTEDIAKLWGWETARAAHPDLKLLVSTLEPGGRPTTVQRTLIEAWGIAPEDVVCIDRPVRVDLLVGATQMFYNGIYVHPEMREIWSRLGEALRPRAAGPGGSRRIFVTRPPDSLRPCRNGAEVEALFVEHGFDIVRPELLSIPEQVDRFAAAEVVAGFGGSGMFNGIYTTGPARWIVITSDRYLARNEWAIAAAKGDEYHHFFGEAELKPGDTAQGWRVFQSPFAFDFARDGDALRALLRD
jgi:capsular polysaccharide biosynthesis protein